MEKIDLHIHTIQTTSDPSFTFCLDVLKNYVIESKISCIAITNHNYFDLSQYKDISQQLSIIVFPGIEIDIENGHLLLISDIHEIEDFDLKCKEISKKTKNGCITCEELKFIFPDLSRYIMIPHYYKEPSLSPEVITKIKPFITAGEVSSPKKFLYCLNDPDSLVPVYFSDLRIEEGIDIFPARQTYIDIGEISFSSIRLALRDKNKVFLSREDGHKFFDVLGNGLRLSNGLNVVLGERSTGKTYTLDKIYKNFENIKYIRQFELLERDDNDDAQRFNGVVNQKQSLFTQNYLKEFKFVVDDISEISLESNNRDIEKYLRTLLKNAKESERADSFSKAKLFNETFFSENELRSLKILIEAIITIIDNTEYKIILNKYISGYNVKALAIELMEKYIAEYEINLKRRWINDIINTIKKSLQIHTASTLIEDIDVYKVILENKKIEKFIKIVELIKQEKIISETDIQGFKIVAQTKKFINATDLKDLSGKKISFYEAYQAYNSPYEFIKKLREINGLEEADYFKYFVRIEYQVLNKYNTPVSGGERSEFRLLQEITDSQQKDMLLIDEPESSFDNLFLKNEVNALIKDISKLMPVVIVTHNNTVGASIKPDYILYTYKVIKSDRSISYEIYSGYPSDKYLLGLDGRKMKNFDILLDCLEAGQDAYIERGTSYEILKN